MAGEREPTENGADLQLPEADPSCWACSRFTEFVETVVGLLGQVDLDRSQMRQELDGIRRERDEGRQRISVLEAQVAELQRAQFGRQSEVQSKPADAPPPADAPEPGEPPESGDTPESGDPAPDSGTPEPPPERQPHTTAREAGGSAAAARAAGTARGRAPLPAMRGAVPDGRPGAQHAVRDRLGRRAARDRARALPPDLRVPGGARGDRA